MTTGNASEKVDMGLPGRIAAAIGRGDASMGIPMTIVAEGEVMGRHHPKPLSPERDAMSRTVTMEPANFAVAAAAPASQPFLKQYGRMGLLLAADSRPERRDEQLRQIASASPEELQKVLRVNAKSVEDGTRKEVELRFEQYLKNSPEVEVRIKALDNGKTYAENLAAERRAFGNEDFRVQQQRAMLPSGSPVMLDQSASNNLRASRRGFKAIEGRLIELGLKPEVSMTNTAKGARRSTEAARAAAIGAQPAAKPAGKRRLSRDGQDLGR